MTWTFENVWNGDGKHCSPKREKVDAETFDWWFTMFSLECFSEFHRYIFYNCDLRIKGHLDKVTEKAMAPHSSTLAWKIPWAEEPGGLQSTGSQRVGHDWATSLSLFTFMHWRRKWQPPPVFLPGESQGRQSLVGCCLWGHRVRHGWSNEVAAAYKVKQRFPKKLGFEWSVYGPWHIFY